jgi:disulfide bond formation protein DsbB
MRHLFNPGTAMLLLAGASATALATAFTGQYLFDLQPCVLCIYQRWPYALAIALCLGGRTPLARAAAPWVLMATALVLALNAGIAVYHVGVEQHWWTGSEACVGPGGAALTLEALRAQIMATPVTRCDEIEFSLFGVSMAGYNVLFSLGLALYAGLAGRQAIGKNGITPSS